MQTEDKKFVVVENGQRVTLAVSAAQAAEEAARRKKLNESQGNAQKVEVKQNLMG